jgi:hypothetical protein
MTEAEWLTATDPKTMLTLLSSRASRRKLRLFACACCRRVPDAVSCPQRANALDVAERLAEGLATNEERRQATASLMAVKPFVPSLLSALFGNPSTAAWDTAARASSSPALIKVPKVVGGPGATTNPAWEQAVREEHAVQASFLRDIFGNPFHPATFEPAWRTSTATALARQMYESRDFSPMPILADALQDAGCDSEDVLRHCRGDGPHVRGCWVVDCVLGMA